MHSLTAAQAGDERGMSRDEDDREFRAAIRRQHMPRLQGFLQRSRLLVQFWCGRLNIDSKWFHISHPELQYAAVSQRLPKSGVRPNFFLNLGQRPEYSSPLQVGPHK